MRIALVCPYSFDVPGGVATHVVGLAQWLAAQGHAPLVVAPGRDPAPEAAGVELELLGPATALPFNGSVARLALGRGQTHQVRRLMADADVVHVHEPLTPGIAHAAARAARHLVVTHHASFSLPRPLAAALRARARRLGPRQSIAVSRAAAITASTVTGLEPEVIPNALLLPPAGPRSTRPGTARVGFLGRLSESRKGFDVFRRVAELARARGLGIRFVAAGPGMADAGPVELLGPVGDKWEFLSELDLLVAPNTHGESFGMVIIEALAAGCDVVASDLPAFNAVIKQAGIGATFRNGDPEAALSAITDRLSREHVRQNARASAQQWSWDVLGPRVLEVYRTARLGP